MDGYKARKALLDNHPRVALMEFWVALDNCGTTQVCSYTPALLKTCLFWHNNHED